MKKLSILAAAALVSLATAAVQAQVTTGYLYYAGGAIPSGTDATAEDGTLTGDNGVFSVLVADVTIDASTVTVENWRYAAGAGLGNPLPEDNTETASETELATWLFTEDCVFAIDGRIYVITGDWNGDGTRTTSDFGIFADADEFGQLGAWSFTAEFPTPPDDQAIGAAAHANVGGTDYIYYLGGTGTPLDRVLVGEVQSADGDITSWTATTAIPSGDWFNRATTAQGTVIHGAGNQVDSGERDVSSATIQAGGTLGAWTAAPDYPGSGTQWDYVMVTATSSGGTDFVVVAGGSALDGGVYTAPVTGGVVGAWNTTNALPTAVRRVTGVAIGDVIIVTGGTAGSSSVSAATTLVQVGRIDDSGVITWTDSDTDAGIAAMSQARGFGGAAFLEADFPTDAESWSLYR